MEDAGGDEVPANIVNYDILTAILALTLTLVTLLTPTLPRAMRWNRKAIACNAKEKEPEWTLSDLKSVFRLRANRLEGNGHARSNRNTWESRESSAIDLTRGSSLVDLTLGSSMETSIETSNKRCVFHICMQVRWIPVTFVIS